jgi:hypothetical protein
MPCCCAGDDRRVQNYPVINHSRARGLLHKLRFRLLSIMVRGNFN